MIDLLQETVLFKGCTTQELKEVAKICERAEFKVGEYIFRAKTDAMFLYIIREGVVELRFSVTHYQAAREITIDKKVRGDVFGWSALTEQNTYTLSAIVVKDSKLLRFKSKDLRILCEKDNHLGYIIMKNISEIIGYRFELVQKMLIDLIQKDLRDKEL